MDAMWIPLTLIVWLEYQKVQHFFTIFKEIRGTHLDYIHCMCIFGGKYVELPRHAYRYRR